MKGRFTTVLYATLLVLAASFGGATIGRDSSWHEQAAQAATLFGPGMTPYAHVLVVAKSGGDYATITSALNSITDNGASSRYLVWVAPGVYAEAVTMKPYVDIQGAGEDVTTIRSAGNSTGTVATVKGASNAEIRYLTVQNTGGDSYAIAFLNDSAAPRLSHVILSSSGATSVNTGMYSANGSAPTTDDVRVLVSGSATNQGVFYTQCPFPVLSNVTILVAGQRGNTETQGVTTDGAFNSSSKLTLRDVNIDISGNTGQVTGVYASHSSLNVRNSSIEARGGTSNVGVSASGLTSESHNIIINDSTITGSKYTLESYSGANVGWALLTCLAALYLSQALRRL